VLYSKELNRLFGMLDESYPAHQSLQDQGIFQIGYYHRKEKRYEKKSVAGETAETI
jgi:CRISPR-associated protein Csd1